VEIKILRILGVLGYGTYAWHWLLAKNGFLLDSFVLHTITSIMLACITYKFIEQPELKF